MVVPQTAEIKTVPVCNRSIHCNTEHEARRRKTDATLPVLPWVLRPLQHHTESETQLRVPHTHTTDTSHTSPTSFSLSFSPVPLPQPSSPRPHRGAKRDGPRSGRGCLDSAYAHTHTHSLTHRALASDCAIWASRELYTKTITRSLCRLSSAHLELLCSCVSLDM